MDSKELFLKKDVLGNLCLRVAKTLPCMNVMDDSTMWNQPIELCQRIEANIREVDNVIMEVNKDSVYFQNTSGNPKNSQVMLARVYILLYYLHHDDNVYQTLVFPVLQKHMGIYYQRLLNDIQKKIKEILEMDRLLEQSREEKRKNSKPKYSFIILKSGEADECFSAFCQESLFSDLSNYLEVIKERYFPNFDVAAIWLTAKDVVGKLWQEKVPENFIDRIYNKLKMSGDTGHVEYGAAEAVILCAYVMMRSVNKSDHFKNAIAYIESIPTKHNNYSLLFDEIRSVMKLIDEGKVSFDDYDYTGGTQQSAQMYSKADVEQMMKESWDKNKLLEKEAATLEKVLRQEVEQLRKKLLQSENEKEQLKQQNDELRGKVQTAEGNDLEETTWHDKVRLELLLKLFKKVGLNLEKYGNKTKAAEIFSVITQLPLSTCKNYCSNQNLNINEHEEEILKLNSKLQALDVPILL